MAAFKGESTRVDALKKLRGGEFETQIKSLKDSNNLQSALSERDQTGLTLLMNLALASAHEEIKTLREAVKGFTNEEQSKLFEESDERGFNAIDFAVLAKSNSARERSDVEGEKKYKATADILNDWKNSVAVSPAATINQKAANMLLGNAVIALFKKRGEELANELDAIVKKGKDSVTEEEIGRVNHLNLLLHREALSVNNSVLKDDADKNEIRAILKSANAKMISTANAIGRGTKNVDPGTMKSEHLEGLSGDVAQDNELTVIIQAIYDDLTNFLISNGHISSKNDFAIELAEFEKRQRDLRDALRNYAGKFGQQESKESGEGTPEATIIS